MSISWLSESATNLGTLISNGKIDPIELTEVYLDEIEKHSLRNRIRQEGGGHITLIVFKYYSGFTTFFILFLRDGQTAERLDDCCAWGSNNLL